jgi:hypothetical protein
MGEIFQRVDDEARVLDPHAAIGTIANMGLQGLNPEAHLVIEEEIDLVWKQVPVIHGVSEKDYGARLVMVSADFVTGIRSDRRPQVILSNLLSSRATFCHPEQPLVIPSAARDLQS